MNHSHISWITVSQFFRQQIPVDELIESVKSACGDIIDWRCYTAQEELMNHTILENTATKYPPSPRYTLQFLRAYTEEIEKAGIEDIYDKIYEIICELNPQSDTTSGFISFDLPIIITNPKYPEPLKTIALNITPQHNEVGLRMWESGYLLTEYILANPNNIQGKRVVELGAGLGLTGITASICCHSKQTILTDCAINVLDNLKDTCASNQIELDDGVIKIEDLDWLIGGDEVIKILGSVDTILAADVLYDPTIVPYFVNVLETLLSVDGGKTEDQKTTFSASPNSNTLITPTTDLSKTRPIAYVAATLRNPSTLQLFCQLVLSKSIPFFECDFKSNNDKEDDENMYWFNQNIFHYDPTAVRLFAIGDMPEPINENEKWFPVSLDPLTAQ